jgi:AbrB family looped-hinge helix DNA binding protein
MIVVVARTTLRARGQLTLPEEVRTAAHLEEGDLLDAEITTDGILLRPQKLIDSTQAWFWSSEWQAGEREAEADRAAGRAATFGSEEEFLAALRKRAKGTRRSRRS